MQIDHHNAAIGGVCCARTLVNEPLSYLTAEQLGKDIIKLGKNYGFTTEVLKKPKIKSLIDSLNTCVKETSQPRNPDENNKSTDNRNCRIWRQLPC